MEKQLKLKKERETLLTSDYGRGQVVQVQARLVQEEDVFKGLQSLTDVSLQLPCTHTTHSWSKSRNYTHTPSPMTSFHLNG